MTQRESRRARLSASRTELDSSPSSPSRLCFSQPCPEAADLSPSLSAAKSARRLLGCRPAPRILQPALTGAFMVALVRALPGLLPAPRFWRFTSPSSAPSPRQFLTACPALSSILRPGAEHPAGGTCSSLLPPSFLLPPSPRPRVMERASRSPSSAPSNAPSNRATSAPAGPIRAGNIWAPTSAGCGREVMRSSVAAGTRRSCHRRHSHQQHRQQQQHRHHLLQERRGKDGAALPLEPGLAG